MRDPVDRWHFADWLLEHTQENTCNFNDDTILIQFDESEVSQTGTFCSRLPNDTIQTY